jgi:uncharacterized protein YqgC (DUF456 family)
MNSASVISVVKTGVGMEMDWQSIGSAGIYTLAGLLCIIGFILSCLSLSGTWLVLAAAGLVSWMNWPEFPGVGTFVLFLALCVAIELAEALASVWGVKKRGGSRAAGWAALVGGLLGLLLGSAIPVPVVGNLIGMILGSFVLAFLVEHSRMKKIDHAAHVAAGAVIARLSIIFLKISATMAMTFVLVVGLILTRK